MPNSNPKKRQVQLFCDCVFEPDDIVEVRLLPSGKRSWHKAAELPDKFARLYKANQNGQNIYVGANPRTAKGASTADGVALARTLFADFDGVSVDDAMDRLGKDGELVLPTLVLHSGHGCHFYWRLKEPITDLAEWTRLQKHLIAALDSDPSIHDPPRIMRLPGFLNVKSEPFVQCEIIEADVKRTYDVAMFFDVLPAASPEPTPPTPPPGSAPSPTLDTIRRATLYAAKVPGLSEGEGRNRTAFKLSAALVNDFLLSDDAAWRLLASWNNTNIPPLENDELQATFASAHKSAKKPPGTKAESKSESRYKVKHGGKKSNKPSNTKKKPPEPTQAETLIKLSEAAELWHTPDGDGYATVKVGEHVEHYPIRSRQFRLWLDHQYFKGTGSAANAEARSSALSVIEAKSKFDGAEHGVSLRVAQHGESVYVDLCDRDWQAIEISVTGWRLTANPLVRFRRAKAMLPLPTPVAGGSVAELRQFINVTNEHYPLVVSWLVAALRPVGPYPVLCLHGEQGSAKSTGAKLLRAIVDPNTSPLRSEPKEPRDLMIAANNGWVAAIDNLSRVPNWLSDCLCRLSTGGGFSTRTLYENDEETIFDATRPVILTGIEEVASRGDLIDRSLLVSLPVIPEAKRKPEAELLASFNDAKPRIFGALLDAVSCAIRTLPGTKLERLPRMADFALWGTAAETALGLAPGQFMSAYAGNRESANETALDSSLVAKWIIPLADGDGWEGAASDLLAVINEEAGYDRSDGKPGKRPPKYWPASPRALSGELKRLAPNLRQSGIEVDHKRTGKSRTLTLYRKNSETSVTTVTTVTNPKKPANSSDASCDGRGDGDASGNSTVTSTVTAENTVFPEENGVCDASDGSDAKSRTSQRVRVVI